MAQSEQQVSRAKAQLGWGEDNREDYKRRRKNVKWYAIINKIVGKRETSDGDWKLFMDFCMLPTIGLPASGRQLLRSKVGDKEGDNA